MKILLVDDNPVERKMLRICMEGEKWDVAEAGNGEEGLTMARQFLPDAIISDGMMPDMDGFNFLREIRRKVLPEVVFIFYSAVYTGKIEEELARLLGADAFIQKPVAPQELVNRVVEILRSSDQRVKDLTLLDDEATFLRKYNKVLQAAVEKKVLEYGEFKSDSQILIEKLKSELVEQQVRDFSKGVLQRIEAEDMASLPSELRDRQYVNNHLYKPLERVKGICAQLEHDYGRTLTEEEKTYITQIIAAANRAEKLLDMMFISPLVRQPEFEDVFKRMKIFTNILQAKFSRRVQEDAVSAPVKGIRSAIDATADMVKDVFELLGVVRTPISQEGVDLSAIASTIAERLRLSVPERKVEFSIQGDLYAYGDRKLLRLLMVNLLTNAWKFTARAAEAEIEFGEGKIAEQPSFFIRDNGIGFSMTDAHKLFIAFSRLHPPEEFPGTGLGLAIAKKVVERHGGSIRAVGEPGKGAVFSFSLPA